MSKQIFYFNWQWKCHTAQQSRNPGSRADSAAGKRVQLMRVLEKASQGFFSASPPSLPKPRRLRIENGQNSTVAPR